MAASKEQHLFVTVEGKQFPEGTIGRRVSVFFEKSKLRMGKRLAHVSVRKFVSTKTKEGGTQEEAAIVQQVMAHSSKTADRVYVRSNLTKLGSQALDIIERVTADKETSKEDDESEDSRVDMKAATSNVRPATPTIAATKPTAVSSRPSETYQEQDDNSQESDDEKTQQSVTPSGAATGSSYSVSLVSTSRVPPTPNRGLTDKQKEAILKKFEPEITAGTKVSIATAQNRCCTTAIFSVLSTSMKKVKKVVNHVNYLIDNRPKIPPKQLPEPSTSKVHGVLHDFDLMIPQLDQVVGDKSGTRMRPI